MQPVGSRTEAGQRGRRIVLPCFEQLHYCREHQRELILQTGGILGIMRSPRYKMVGRVLAFLLFCLSLSPLSGRADAQMRCAGAPLRSAPCDHIELPATGLTETQVDARMSMMPCCHSLHADRMRGCPLQHSLKVSAAERTATHHCLMTVRVIAFGTSTPPVTHPRWFLTANPALAPPATVYFDLVPASSIPALSASSSALSPHPSQHSHGLRAPPVA